MYLSEIEKLRKIFDGVKAVGSWDCTGSDFLGLASDQLDLDGKLIQTGSLIGVRVPEIPEITQDTYQFIDVDAFVGALETDEIDFGKNYTLTFAQLAQNGRLTPDHYRKILTKSFDAARVTEGKTKPQSLISALEVMTDLYLCIIPLQTYLLPLRTLGSLLLISTSESWIKPLRWPARLRVSQIV